MDINFEQKTAFWSGFKSQFEPAHLKQFLIECHEANVSDIKIQSNEPLFVEIHGRLLKATRENIDGSKVRNLASDIFAANVEAQLNSGKAIDCSYDVSLNRSGRIRFRVNMISVRIKSGTGINISMRLLPGIPPSFDELNTEEELRKIWQVNKGLNIVSGVPGSGKSTLMGAGTRYQLETGIGSNIQEYASPIEFVYDEISAENALISQSEVPTHIRSFAEGIHSSLRRRPTVLIVQESRDLETIRASILAAQYGIPVYTTTHVIGVAETIRRMVTEFPFEEREQMSITLIEMLNLVLTQTLEINPSGTRTALKEWIIVNDQLRQKLLNCASVNNWSAVINKELLENNNHMSQKAELAFNQGLITKTAYKRLSLTEVA